MLAGAALAALATPAALVVLTTSAAAVSHEALWLANPVSDDFNAGANWNTGSVPFGTAFFGNSSIRDLSFSDNTTIGGWTFNPGAANYTFANSFILEFSGAGITINGGSATITNDGDLNFFNASSAGSASITNNCCMAFYDESTAGSANITNYGDLSFNQSSTAGAANITNNSFLEFSGGSTAGNASITNNGFLTFYATSTAGSSTVANTGIVYFAGDSTAGNASITNNGLLTFDEASTAGRATITNNDGITFFSGVSSGGTARLIANGMGVVDFSPLMSDGTTVGSLEGSGNFFLGSKTITVGGNGLSTEVSGVIQDGGTCCGTGGALVKEGAGTLTLSGANTYTGPTTVDGGALVVNGSIATSSGLTVDAGALVGGVGVLPSTTINGALSPGNSIGTITVNGNLAFGAGSFYLVEVSPTAADRTNVTGAATLNGTVLATFAPGSYITRQYTILHANGGLGGTTFAGRSGVPAGFNADLSYGANDVFLNLSAALGLSSALSRNERNVANAINGYFNNGGALPPNFYGLFGLTGAHLANALTLLSGEAATGAQQVAFQLTSQFFALMLDPLVYGGAGMVAGGGAGFAPGGPLRFSAREMEAPEIALAYAMALKAPPAPAAALLPERRWNVWAGGFGGTNRTQGDPVGVGSHDVSARAGGYAGGLDYRIGAGTTVGFALAGGFTNWGLANGLGGGNSDAFQAGLYGVTRSGPAYLAGAASFAEHWMATDRFALAGDHLTARFDAQSWGGRIEGGWRFATLLGGVAPYAAVQAQSFHTPAYSETDATGGGFGLSYNARNASDTRSELGARFDHKLPLADMALLALHARAAFAHDWASDPALTAAFQTLPGASFIVNGAAPVPNSALLSAGGELRFLNGWAVAARFDGEFANRAQTYAGTGSLRYAW